MKYYIEYRLEGKHDEHHTKMLTPAEIKPKFRELMAKEVIIEAVRDEDGDKLTDPTSSGFDPTRKFRLKYRKENGVKIRYTRWGSMNHTQSHFYKMIGNDWVIFGIEENTAKGAVPEKYAKPTRKSKEQKSIAKEMLKDMKNHNKDIAKQRKRNKKRRNQFIILLIMGAVAASLLILFLSATNASNDPHGPGRVVDDLSSSGEEDGGIDFSLIAMPMIAIVGILVVIVVISTVRETAR